MLSRIPELDDRAAVTANGRRWIFAPQGPVYVIGSIGDDARATRQSDAPSGYVAIPLRLPRPALVEIIRNGRIARNAEVEPDRSVARWPLPPEDVTVARDAAFRQEFDEPTRG